MRLVLDPSLERFALVKIVTHMWNQTDVRCLMSEFDFSWAHSVGHGMWQQIEERVLDKVPSLPLPEFLREKVKCLIKPIGQQILEWMEYHDKNGHRRIILPAEFGWTCHGTIDRKKTAEVLMKDQRLGVMNRFELACFYCLESDIRILWNEISKDAESLRYTVSDQDEYLSFWESKMRYGGGGSRNASCSPQRMFEVSAVSGNKAATEYFFGKLTVAEKQECLLETAKGVDDAETLCFLLMQMHEQDQGQVFHEDPYYKLKRFLKWPFQSLFGEVVKHGLEFIDCHDFLRLLCVVVHRIETGYKDYRDTFRILWQAGKPCCKDYITRAPDYYVTLFGELLKMKDKQNIQLIIQDASVEDKGRLIDSALVIGAWDRLFLEKDWDLLGFLIHACLSTEEERLRFKKEFEMRYDIEENLLLDKRKWNELFSL